MLLLTEVCADNRAAAEAADLNLDLAVDSTTAARIKVCTRQSHSLLLHHACIRLH